MTRISLSLSIPLLLGCTSSPSFDATEHAESLSDARLRMEVEEGSVPLRIEVEGVDAGDRTFTRVVGRVVGVKARGMSSPANPRPSTNSSPTSSPFSSRSRKPTRCAPAIPIARGGA